MQEQISLMGATEEVEEIESVPTPLAKTVTGDEIHVRLRHGQLAVVPVDALLDEVEQRGGSYFRGGLAQRNEATDTYGPIDGFRLRLSVQRTRRDGATVGTSRHAAAGGNRRAGRVPANCRRCRRAGRAGAAAEFAVLGGAADAAVRDRRRDRLGLSRQLWRTAVAQKGDVGGERPAGRAAARRWPADHLLDARQQELRRNST